MSFSSTRTWDSDLVLLTDYYEMILSVNKITIDAALRAARSAHKSSTSCAAFALWAPETIYVVKKMGTTTRVYAL